jgi:putative SOS response-associated peptidase YedK
MVTRTFAIITTEVNGMIVKLHDRMPVILQVGIGLADDQVVKQAWHPIVLRRAI